MSKLAAVVQVRMGSSRLPGKALAEIGGVPLTEILLRRLGQSRRLDEIVIATTDSPWDDRIEALCVSTGQPCYRGSGENVLLRYIEAAREFGIDHIVRVTGDNPLTDIEAMDDLIELHRTRGADYSHCEGFPLGTATEVVERVALESFYSPELDTSYLEHVTLYICENPDRFKISRMGCQDLQTCRNLRLTVDTDADLRLMNALAAEFGDMSKANTKSVLRFLAERPDIASINADEVQKDPHDG